MVTKKHAAGRLRAEQKKAMTHIDQLLRPMPVQERHTSRALQVGHYVLARALEVNEISGTQIDNLVAYMAHVNLSLRPSDTPRDLFANGKELSVYAKRRGQTIQEAARAILNALPNTTQNTLSEVAVCGARYDGSYFYLNLADTTLAAEHTALRHILSGASLEPHPESQLSSLRIGKLKTLPNGRIDESVDAVNGLLVDIYSAGQPMSVNLAPLAPQI